MARDEVEAAYFTLLRARDEVADLRRFEEYLADELRRMRRFQSEGAALDDTVSRKLRRSLRHTDGPLKEALDARAAVIADEQARIPERLAAAERFVEECEREHAELKHGH
jgi:hypothetical protein